MIDVLKKLAELDADNPNVAAPMLTQESSLATVTNIEGETLHECGMPGMPGAPASFSINATAQTGDEVASMLTQIMNLAGVKPPHAPYDMNHQEIELSAPHIAEPASQPGDIAHTLSMIDDIGADETSGDTPDVGDMADEVSDMANELAGLNGNDTPEMNEITDEVQGMADHLATINKGGDWDNSADPEINPSKDGDELTTIGKAKSNPFTGLGNNNLANESVDQVSLQLLKAYAEFKNQ